MHETYYTPEQLAQLEARREEVGEDQIAAIEREWAELSAQMKAHRDAGTDPSDPEVRALAERWRDLTDGRTLPYPTVRKVRQRRNPSPHLLSRLPAVGAWLLRQPRRPHLIPQVVVDHSRKRSCLD